jgi:threonine synthase
MKYVSTRGVAPTLAFGDVLLTGLARDGGLYVPESWPTLADDALARWADLPYAELAVEVMWPFVEGSIDRDTFVRLVVDAYATFEDPDVVPLRELGDGRWLLELFHGPTLAFKDVALQLVGRLFDHVLSERDERVTIVGATSGDTGSAAIEACRDRHNVDIFVLHPHGRVSDVQRRQMTTVLSPNVHNVAIDGTFDDCQDLVKALFADEPFRDRHHLSAVNSINWARVMAQIVYYVSAAARLRGGRGPVGFCVPTGNFGNIFAGYAALRMGVPIRHLVVASNRNDVLTRFFTTGSMAIHEVHPTMSPSMDIQVSSNLERLLFEMYGRRGSDVAEVLTRFRADGRVEVEAERLAGLREVFDAYRVDEEQTAAVMKATYERAGLLVDPHTAVGLGAADHVALDPQVPLVCLATADPAKFPDAVEAATGVRPPLPTRLVDLFERPEHYDVLPNDLDQIRTFVAERARG